MGNETSGVKKATESPTSDHRTERKSSLPETSTTGDVLSQSMSVNEGLSSKMESPTSASVIESATITTITQTTTATTTISTNTSGEDSQNQSSSVNVNNSSGPVTKGIVIVRKKDENTEKKQVGQEEFARLAAIPRFLPILSSTVSGTNISSGNLNSLATGSIGSPVTSGPLSPNGTTTNTSLFSLSTARLAHQPPRSNNASQKPLRRTASLSDDGHVDYKGVLLLSARYQEHLKQCAEAVTFDQNSLCVSMKDADIQLQQLTSMLTERQRKYSRLVEQLRKVSEMRRVLIRMRTSADCIARSLDELNSRLPDDLRLEPFCFVKIHETDLQFTSKISNENTS